MAHRVAGRVNWRTFTPLFWMLFLAYLSNKGLAIMQAPRPQWMRHYVDDFLCLPLLLTTTLFLMRLLYDPQVKLSGYHVGFVVVYASLAFEWFFPRFMPRYTSDVLDVVLYALGGGVFYFFLNK